MACCRVGVSEQDILRFWLMHYRPHVDVMAVLIVREQGEDITGLTGLCTQAGAVWDCTGPMRYNGIQTMPPLRRLVQQHEADWVVHADSDELLWEIESIRDIAMALVEEEADHAGAWMADRLAPGGKLGSLEGLITVADLDAAFPVRAAVTHRIAKGCTYKVCFCRWPATGATHTPGPSLSKRSKRRLTLEHFKWRTGLEERLQKRIEDCKAAGFAWWQESRRLLDELQAHGRIRAETCLASRAGRIHGWSGYEAVYLDAVHSAVDGDHIVEVGVWQGRSLCFLAEAVLASGKSIRIDGIDLFRSHADGTAGSLRHPKGKAAGCSWLDVTSEHLQRQGLLDHVNLVQASSPQAARLYPDASLHFVWIDGDHGHDAVLADCHAWWPKIKPGGAMGVHDYSHTQVRSAVDNALLAPTPVATHVKDHTFVACK